MQYNISERGVCGDLAVILQEILRVKGYQARTVQLIRQIGSAYDTHVVTEVWDKVQQKFIMLDPTFNLMIKGENSLLNAMEIRNAYLYKKQQLQQIYIGSGNGALLAKYYVSYYPLYNNVLLVKNNTFIGTHRILSRLPVAHYFLGGKYYVDITNHDIEGYRLLYLLFYVYLPILVILLLFVSFTHRFFSRKQGVSI